MHPESGFLTQLYSFHSHLDLCDLFLLMFSIKKNNLQASFFTCVWFSNILQDWTSAKLFKIPNEIKFGPKMKRSNHRIWISKTYYDVSLERRET